MRVYVHYIGVCGVKSTLVRSPGAVQNLKWEVFPNYCLFLKLNQNNKNAH